MKIRWFIVLLAVGTVLIDLGIVLVLAKHPKIFQVLLIIATVAICVTAMIVADEEQRAARRDLSHH